MAIEALGIDQGALQGVQGRGGFVSNWFTPQRQAPITYTYAHTGSGDFYVQIHCDKSHFIPINASGTVRGTAVVDYEVAPCVWEVTTAGPWRIVAQP